MLWLLCCLFHYLIVVFLSVPWDTDMLQTPPGEAAWWSLCFLSPHYCLILVERVKVTLCGFPGVVVSYRALGLSLPMNFSLSASPKLAFPHLAWLPQIAQTLQEAKLVAIWPQTWFRQALRSCRVTPDQSGAGHTAIVEKPLCEWSELARVRCFRPLEVWALPVSREFL